MPTPEPWTEYRSDHPFIFGTHMSGCALMARGGVCGCPEGRETPCPTTTTREPLPWPHRATWGEPGPNPDLLNDAVWSGDDDE